MLQNTSGGWFHPVHIHLVDFQVVRRNGAAPYAFERGWKDVVYIGPNETVELVMRFKAADQVDPTRPATGHYVMHCNNLVHEDNDMMTQFSTDPADALKATNAGMKDMGHSMMVQWTLDA